MLHRLHMTFLLFRFKTLILKQCSILCFQNETEPAVSETGQNALPATTTKDCDNHGPPRCFRCMYLTRPDNFEHFRKCSSNSERIQLGMICNRPVCSSGGQCMDMLEIHFFEQLH